MSFNGINYLFLCVYIYLVLGPEEMKKYNLGECIPKRTKHSDAKSLAANVNRDLDKWNFDEVNFTERNKKELIALMVEISVLALISTTCYTFGGRIFRQLRGLGIGLRASAALARLVMCNWDSVWGYMQMQLGLSVQLFCRYVDDIRLFIFPINKGWTWCKDKGWQYNMAEDESYCQLNHTAEQIKKSLNCVWNFLSFTMETENDFSNGYLATLDCQTRVLDSGMVTYRYYSKPMASNMVIQLGTALSRTCVFSSLRQDLVRRMLMTSDLEMFQVRLSIVSDYVQLLVNGDHKYAFIKAIIQQGLTKYLFMKWRSELAPNHRMYSPLHRGREYKQEDRTMDKYLRHMDWFKGNMASDEYKDLWKASIKRKGVWKRGSKDTRKVPPLDIESVMFVPATPANTLLNNLLKCEEQLRLQIGWGIKLVERPGTPLALQFIKKEAMVHGCPLGKKCVICDDLGIKCSKKRVVYLAECLTCEEMKEYLSNEQDHLSEEQFTQAINYFDASTYVGETSRMLRCRANEHIESVNRHNTDSFILEHWMDKHGLNLEPPRFRFKAVRSFKDCLSRQLSEALMINDKGRLNRKHEYTNNELIKLETNLYSWELDKKQTDERKSRKRLKDNIEQFVTVISDVELKEKERLKCNNLDSTYRFKRLEPSSVCGRSKRIRMETSTPINARRSPNKLNLSASPVEMQSLSLESSGSGESYLNPMGKVEEKMVSKVLLKLNITPPKIESKLLQLVRQTIAATEYFDSIEFRRKTCSKRTRTTSDNFMDVDEENYTKTLKKGSSIDNLLKSMDWDKWVEETKWKRYDSDSSSREENASETVVSDKMDLKLKTPNGEGSLSNVPVGLDLEPCCELKTPVGEGSLLHVPALEYELKTPKVEAGLLQVPVALEYELKNPKVEASLLQAPVMLGGEYKSSNEEGYLHKTPSHEEAAVEDNSLNAPEGEIGNSYVNFEDNDVDQEEFSRVLEEKTRNKLYSIFQKKHLNLGTPVNKLTIGEKRKISPTAATPEPIQPRLSTGGKEESELRRRILFSNLEKVSTPRPRLNTIAGDMSKRKNITPRRRTKSFVNEEGMMKNQKRITDMLKKKVAAIETQVDEERQEKE